MKPGEKVERLLEARDWSISKLAKKVGRSRQVLTSWVRGDYSPKDEIGWQPIAEAFGMTLRELLDPRDNTSKFLAQLGEPGFPVDGGSVQIPLWAAVPCGDWAEPDETIDFIEVPGFIARRDRIATRVQGDSMFPRLQDGDLLVFQLDKTPRYGRIVLARNDQNEATCKVLRRGLDGPELEPINPNHQNSTAHRWEQLGYLVAILRDLGSQRGELAWDEGGLGP